MANYPSDRINNDWHDHFVSPPGPRLTITEFLFGAFGKTRQGNLSLHLFATSTSLSGNHEKTIYNPRTKVNPLWEPMTSALLVRSVFIANRS
jgi:hypothetical protein